MLPSFYYQFLVDIVLNKNSFPLPGFLKDIAKRKDIPDFGRLMDFFGNELESVQLDRQITADYFLFIARHTILFQIHKRDLPNLIETVNLVRHRMAVLKNFQSISLPVQPWEKYLSLSQVVLQRILRHISIESFESHIDAVDWSAFDKNSLVHLSALLGYAYLQEEHTDQINKARIWLLQAIRDQKVEDQLSNHLLLMSLYLESSVEESRKRAEELAAVFVKLKDSVAFSEIKIPLQSILVETKLALLEWDIAHKTVQDGSPFIGELDTLEQNYQKQASEIPGFASVGILHRQESLRRKIAIRSDKKSLQQLLNRNKLLLEQCDSVLKRINDPEGILAHRLFQVNSLINLEEGTTEKEIKEIIQLYKKQNNYPAYIQGNKAFFDLLILNQSVGKAFDMLGEMMKYGIKKLDEGSPYVFIKGFQLANDLFIREVDLPGRSWMIDILWNFFDFIRQGVSMLETRIQQMGRRYAEMFRKEYLRFGEVSSFNIRVYLAYQYYTLKILSLGLSYQNDPLSEQLLEHLIEEIEDVRNPVHFIKGDWEDFKDVPDAVRNKTLNRCIDISKGDLPIASDHLAFSYRNLRSYITFKEVNRLGFFTEMQQTDNKQLEQGIRYMFYDLYKQGTIFEVVYDMPRFLVKYARDGFFAGDMEQELLIKSTTAKKYLKIMTDIGLIRQDRAQGKKHYYKLIRENVMKRLGRDQNTRV